MAFSLDTPYYPIPGSGPEATFGAIMEMLLKTRLKLHLETNRHRYDEDVNTYLAGLLVSYIDPIYLAAVCPVLCPYGLDLYEAVRKAEDRPQVYRIYKVNADDLLISLGIFRRLWQEAKAELTRMKEYYACASEVQRRIYGRTTAVAEIQTKLSGESELYLTILSQTRSEYLNLIERVGPEEMTALNQALRQLEKELPLKAKQNELLDTYSQWLKGPKDLQSRQKLLEMIEQLKTLDPHFRPESFLSELGS